MHWSKKLKSFLFYAGHCCSGSMTIARSTVCRFHITRVHFMGHHGQPQWGHYSLIQNPEELDLVKTQMG